MGIVYIQINPCFKLTDSGLRRNDDIMLMIASENKVSRCNHHFHQVIPANAGISLINR